MALKQETKAIDGVKFETTQFAAMRALGLMGKLVKTIGPAIGVISSADPNTPIDELAPVLAGALSNLNEDDLGRLALEILSGTTATLDENGTLRRIDILTEENFNRVFNGRLMVMFKAVLHALQVNYADFGLGSAPKATESAPSPVAETVSK